MKYKGDCKQCTLWEEHKMDILFQVMDNENDITLTDKDGVVLRISDSYESHYGVARNEIVGKSVYDLEKQGVFSPSVTAMVLKDKKKVTVLQKNKLGTQALTTGVPIFDDSGELQYVISFHSIDIANVSTTQDKYVLLSELIAEYNAEISALRTQGKSGQEFIAKSKVMSEIEILVTQIADTAANILITGETGVGKSMVARMIHANSGRKDSPFIEINCGAIPLNLIESELFGYEKGSFTGASNEGKRGKIELAEGGTLFLDEIGELPFDMQTKLLQVIQEKFITRIGSLKKIKVDFRLISATNKDLKMAINDKQFREDLYYRLNVIPIHIPPLRERSADIPVLCERLMHRFNKQYNKNVVLLPDVAQALEKQKWPGNIRQLENVLERLVVTSQKHYITLEDLPPEIVIDRQESEKFVGNSLNEIMRNYEKRIITEAYDKHSSSIAVGKVLGISQTTAARKLREYIEGYGKQGKL